MRKLWHFERHSEGLLPRRQFFRRWLVYAGLSLGILTVSLWIGVWGYHVFEGLPWLDALLNASMILGGMGPVNPLQTAVGKLFASFYALFSGMIFLVVFGVLIAPAAHRLLHMFRLDDEAG